MIIINKEVEMKFVRPVIIMLIAILISGCSAFRNNSVESIQIITDKSANDGNATRVDVVFVYGDAGAMPKTVGEWFKGEKARVLNNPENFKVVSLRMPLGLIQEVELPSKHSSADHVLVYVDFHDGEGQAPMDLTRYSNPVIIVKDDHYKLSWRR